MEIGINSFQNLSCLRTLDLSRCAITKLPDSIGNLVQLRYLGLRDTGINKLPDSIRCLYNLLVLDLCGNDIEELPKDMKKLINLRHLVSEEAAFYYPPGIGQIMSLQTLPGFKVGRAEQHCGGLGELKDLVHLRGRLVIHGLENVASLEDAEEAKMNNKEHLKSLILKFGYKQSVAGVQGLAYDEHMNQTLENLRPHNNLKVLKIKQYNGSKSPSWLCDPSFSNMVHVELNGFMPSFTFLPPLGQLPSLQTLQISNMRGVRSVGREFCVGDSVIANGFPSLEQLTIHSMHEWVEWHGVEDGDFPCLQTLHIYSCLKLTSLPACSLGSLKKLKINSCWELTSLSACNLTSLEKLSINQCHKLRLIPVCLPSLKKLKICLCQKLSSLACDLPSLEYLRVTECEELNALPALTSLQTLILDSTDKLFASISSSNLPSLQELTVLSSSADLLTLGFPSLRKLFLWNCKALGSIRGLQSLTSLKHLEIKHCPDLCFSVDDELPPTLQWVEVLECPGLREWCQRQGIQYTYTKELDALREDNEYFFEDELNIVDDEDNKDKESSEHNDVYEV